MTGKNDDRSIYATYSSFSICSKFPIVVRESIFGYVYRYILVMNKIYIFLLQK